MPAETMPWSPVVRAFATWLSDRNTSAGDIGSRFRQGIGVPQVAATRVGGVDPATLIQLDCWAASDMAAEALAVEVCTEVELIGSLRPSVEGVLLASCAVLGVRSFPDDAYSRYICDIVLAAAS
jgi:hypothetical protein